MIHFFLLRHYSHLIILMELQDKVFRRPMFVVIMILILYVQDSDNLHDLEELKSVVHQDKYSGGQIPINDSRGTKNCIKHTERPS